MVFSVTYNPALPNIHKILNSLKPVLDSSERCKSVFKNGIIVGYRKGRSLTDMLVNRMMPKDPGTLSTQRQDKSVSSTDKDENDTCNICKRTFKNGRARRIHESRSHKDQDANSVVEKGFTSCEDKRCKTCKARNFGKSFNSSSTGICYNINQEMNCKTKNVYYLLTCESCDDQYVGETKRQLNYRIKSHNSDIRLKKNGLPIVKHFEKCSPANFNVTAIEKCRSRDSYIRKARECFCCKLLQPKIDAEKQIVV